MGRHFLFVGGGVAAGVGTRLTARARADPPSTALVSDGSADIEEIVVLFFVDFSEVVPFLFRELFL